MNNIYLFLRSFVCFIFFTSQSAVLQVVCCAGVVLDPPILPTRESVLQYSFLLRLLRAPLDLSLVPWWRVAPSTLRPCSRHPPKLLRNPRDPSSWGGGGPPIPLESGAPAQVLGAVRAGLHPGLKRSLHHLTPTDVELIRPQEHLPSGFFLERGF